MTGLTSLLLWYLAITLAGWITFPLAYRLFKGLPDRGVSVSKILAWLLWGYLFWMFASVGIIRNEWFGILACLLILAGINLWLLREGGFHELIEWLKTNRRTIFVIEMLFMVSFIGWAMIRATNPEALGTEKPMELAFINAILRSPTFPPHDPWLSGYSISYYHFGYVLVAMLSKLTGTSGGVAFNLGSALIFGLAAIGAFGLIFNILNARSKPIEQGKALGVSLFGPLFLLAFSNFEGFLHSLHNRGLFWRMNEAGELTSSFWRWLDILDLNTPPAQPFSWIPDRFWWWWRASRVIQDYDMTFNPREIINEFPFFSFLLADLHPHVLAIPFALLCITLALHILLKKETASQIRIGPIHLCFTPSEMLLAAIITGAMGFLNTWDFPIYVGFIAALVAFRQSAFVEKSALVKRLVFWGRDFIVHGLALGVTGILLYLPFYISFSSQAGGLILNFIYPTRGAHLWVMFGGLFAIMGIYLFFLVRQEKGQSITNPSWKLGFFVTLGLLASFWLLTFILGALAFLKPELRSIYLGSLSAIDPLSIFSEAIVRRWVYAGGWLTLFLILAPTLTLLLRSLRRSPQFPGELGKAEVFVLFLILFGSLLVIVPEFVFLRDQFGWRMNTIFKFYYQAWILWSIASAAGAVILLITLQGRWRLVYQVGLAVLLVAGLVYPVLSLPAKTNQFSLSDWGLDGEAYLESQNPNEYAAIQWLKKAPYGIVAEAVSPTGGSYTGYARAATLSGLPGVLGWMGHESQWRGGGEAMGSRQVDLARLFCSRDPNEIIEIIQKYRIKYIFTGALERSTYSRGSENCPTGFNEAILQEILDPIFQAGDVTVYTIPGQR